MRDGEMLLPDNAERLRLFAHLNAKSREELVSLRKIRERELTHYENAVHIGPIVLEKRRRQAGL